MKPVEIRRVYDEIQRRLDEDHPQLDLSHQAYPEAMATVSFTIGSLLGADNPYGAMMMMALAERVFGAPALLQLKFNVGLASRLEGVG